MWTFNTMGTAGTVLAAASQIRGTTTNELSDLNSPNYTDVYDILAEWITPMRYNRPDVTLLVKSNGMIDAGARFYFKAVIQVVQLIGSQIVALPTDRRRKTYRAGFDQVGLYADLLPLLTSGLPPNPAILQVLYTMLPLQALRDTVQLRIKLEYAQDNADPAIPQGTAAVFESNLVRFNCRIEKVKVAAGGIVSNRNSDYTGL